VRDLARTRAAQWRVRQDVKALFRDFISAPRTNAVDTALQPRERSIDRLYLSIASVSQTLEQLIHLGFDRIIFPIGIRWLFEMILDAMKPTFQLGKPLSKLFFTSL
jgi:hypothetical protein